MILFRRRNETVFLVTSISPETAAVVTTTFIVARDRPRVGQLDGAPPTSSYPSGHGAAVAAQLEAVRASGHVPPQAPAADVPSLVGTTSQ